MHTIRSITMTRIVLSRIVLGLLGALSLGALSAGCGGGGGGGGGPGGGPGGELAPDQAVTASGAVVDEGDRARWAEAMALYNTARAEGWTAEECTQVIQRFEQVSSQHRGGSLLEAIYMTGVVHEQCGHEQQAQEVYGRVLSANERFCGARVARGIQLYRQGNVAGARAEFERSIRDDTRCTEGYVNLAIIQRRDAGTQAEALNNLRRALAIESAYLPAFNQMALLYLNSAMQRASATAGVAGGSAQASGQTQQAPEDESTQAARRAAARRAAAGQMLDLAEVVCRQAQLMDANYAPIYNTWGLINVQQGNIIAALAKFERAFNLDPTLFEAYMNFGELTLSFRGYEDAERAFRRATELQANNYDAWLGLGAALRGLNRIDDALAAYQRAQQVDANRPESYFNIALVYSDYMGGTREQRTQAQEQFRQFAQRARSRPELAEIVQGVERECGCETAQQQGARRDRRGRVRSGYGRARRQCQSGRIEAITCAFRLEDELMQMQRDAEQMQREIEAQAAQMEAQQQQQQQATPPPAEGATPPPAQ